MNARTDWELLLEQRQDLSIANGNLSDLAAAVRRGADLRLYMTHEKYEETMYFQQTYAGEGDDFAGLMSHHHSYAHRGEKIDEPYICIFKYDTSGRFDLMKWKFGDVVLDESQAYPYGVYRWFVCDRWRCVYANDAEGKRVAGDLDELKECVRQGRSVRLGVRQLFGLAEGADRWSKPYLVSDDDAAGHQKRPCPIQLRSGRRRRAQMALRMV